MPFVGARAPPGTRPLRKCRARATFAGFRYENLGGGTDLFPQVYGALEIASIRNVHDFPPQSNGRFELPQVLTPPR